MATMNFSLPDELKARFDARFAGRNKSAVLAACLEAAIEKDEAKARGKLAFDKYMQFRSTRSPVDSALLQNTLDELRREALEDGVRQIKA